MSITNADGSKIELPRSFPFKDALREFTAEDADRLKWLACLHLKAQGWSYSLLGKAFGHNCGHVCRECNLLLDELKAKPADCHER